jgi:hypothetical protein
MPSMTLTCHVCNLPMQKTRSSKPQGEAAHRACKSTVHGSPGAYKAGCRCDICKEAKNAVMREYMAARTARDGYHPTAAWRRKQRGVEPDALVECVLCGKPLKYLRTEAVARPMHKACRNPAPKWLRAGLPGPKQQRALDRIAAAARGTTGGKRVFTSGPCAWCGEQFVKAQAKWCSSKCKTSARFAAKSTIAFKISPKERLSVYVRDNWTCQLCMQPVDGTLHYLNDWSATLDHIIPQSHQIVPDHSPKALRLAHRWCNGARGDGSNMTESDLIARARGMLLAA